MTTQELKQQAREELGKLQKAELDYGALGKTEIDLFDPRTLSTITNFLDSIIDRTIQQTEERIVGIISQIETDGTDSQGYIIDKIKSLITNKSDINNINK